ncbi:helix-turn-helix domain-containing protein [Paraburkholderia nodosa]|uniref:helix-turn-helix domain-containing protein n=1 Tax=Paraburkholderia nodosa TaxID=392320 RepID=UPI0008418D20|nr:helix-turn-helix domain-containing protein [Paraburkholderia nodosa]
MRRNIDVPIFLVNRKIYAPLYKNPYMKFGQRLREARKAAKLTQIELGKRVGLTQAAISDLENGNTEGTAQTVRLAYALSVTPEWLAEGKGPKTAPDWGYREPATDPNSLGRDPNLSDTIFAARRDGVLGDGAARLIIAAIEADANGLDEELLPLRDMVFTLSRLKTGTLPSVRPLEKNEADAESSLDKNVTEALRGALPSRDAGHAEDERGARGHKRKGG